MDYDKLVVDASTFDFSAENHFEGVYRIANLCGEIEGDASFEKADVIRFSSRITFLREWKHFSYRPKTIRFACESKLSTVKKIAGEINLPQFSAATVSKEILSANTPPELSKDFVLYVGGTIWALDWCPRVHSRPNHNLKCEFIAVSAHPPESSYHKMGAPVSGRGMVQIWCLVHIAEKEEDDKSIVLKRPIGRPKKSFTNANGNATGSKEPKGRPKIIINETDKACEQERSRSIKASQQKKPQGIPRKSSISEIEIISNDQPVQSLFLEYPKVLPETNEVSWSVGDLEPSAMNIESKNESCGQDFMESKQTISDNPSLGMIPIENFIPADLILPRVILCLAHNGKVAWDVKWRPCTAHEPECKSRMGYLAVLLGNGSLEVWEVPSPRIMKILYSHPSEGTDPRFVKLDPVFRCSKLQCGHRQSIPLVVEWSTSTSHDLLLAGCHDGTVAVWKFSADGSCIDTRPLLCFNADTDAIRALAWAPPIDNDLEAANVIVTAGHEGIKFWDIRDPFRPLWDFNSGRRAIYGLDWLPDPRCVVLSFDDGTLKILSLLDAASDVPVTGIFFAGTQFQGYHTYSCSPLAIWSVRVSRTGMVAYCNADGTAHNFQLTRKAVEGGDTRRNKTPHFVCGSFTQDESGVITVNTPFPDTPFPRKNPSKKTLKGSSSFKPKCQNPDGNQILSICYGDEAGSEFVADECLKSEEVGNSKNRRKKNSGKESGDGVEVEVLPPKMVAMHRVRWNMNIGSHRWLCYGGAAGILRCQHIPNH